MQEQEMKEKEGEKYPTRPWATPLAKPPAPSFIAPSIGLFYINESQYKYSSWIESILVNQ